ncbi:MAG: ComEA family DNA-binding protein [Lachnospiraceae bacterium]|nr:ComEA family DNA-binding protein [Lachnospiraceae bacterium]
MTKRIVKSAGVLTGVALALLVQGCGRQSYFETIEQQEESVQESDVDVSDSVDEQTNEIVVQVAGCVKQPGVFTVSSDARVYEAIELAGGLAEDAYEMDLNQAARLEDGQMIYVYSNAEHEELLESEEAASDGRVNLNTADVAELTTLPGIGDSKANLIVSYREEHGKFATPEDIKQIPGIKDGVYNQIQDLIVAN